MCTEIPDCIKFHVSFSRIDSIFHCSLDMMGKNLAKTVEAKIESTKKNMFSKAEASNLPLKDKQRLRRIIENKITPIENRGNKLKAKLRENETRKPQRRVFKQ